MWATSSAAQGCYSTFQRFEYPRAAGLARYETPTKTTANFSASAWPFGHPSHLPPQPSMSPSANTNNVDARRFCLLHLISSNFEHQRQALQPHALPVFGCCDGAAVSNHGRLEAIHVQDGICKRHVKSLISDLFGLSFRSRHLLTSRAIHC